MRTSFTVGLVLLAGTMSSGYAQREQPAEKEKPPTAPRQLPQEHAQQPARPGREQQHSQPAAQSKPPQAAQQRREAPQRAQQTPHPQAEQPRAQQPRPAPVRAPQPPHAQAAERRPPPAARQQAQQTPRRAQPAPRAQPNARAAESRPGQQPQRTRQQATTWQSQRGWAHGGGWQAHSTWQEGRDENWDRDHRTWAQRGGYGGYYIPQASFNLSFGSGHWFRMHSLPSFYMGYPRFSYGGFSFLLVDPWPENWAPNWYDSDEMYIGYDDGYYLYDRNYPGVGLAVTVIL